MDGSCGPSPAFSQKSLSPNRERAATMRANRQARSRAPARALQEESANDGSAVQAAAANPALKLVDFYVGAASAAAGNGVRRFTDDGLELEVFAASRLETKETVRVSKTMAELPTLGDDDVERWLGYWKGKGAL